MTPRNFTATALALALLVTPLPARATSITLVAVGDVGMNLSSKKVYADGVKMWGKKRVPFKKLFQNKKIRKFINGQIRFLNLETVIRTVATPSWTRHRIAMTRATASVDG